MSSFDKVSRGRVDSRTVITALANETYVDQAKALFAGVHRASGWSGDYLLLALDLSKESRRWFTNRGIHVKTCEPPIADDEARRTILLTKLRLFEPEMKKWDQVIYLDTDMIARRSLDALAVIKGFGAVRGIGRPTLEPRFRRPAPGASKAIHSLYRELETSYDLSAPGFNGGLYAFSTDIIDHGTFKEMVGLAQRYLPLITDEEAVLGLYFSGRWTALPIEYNCYVHHLHLTRPDRSPGALLHFVNATPPWSAESPYHDEWQLQLEAAGGINFNQPDATGGLGPVTSCERWNIRMRNVAYRSTRFLWRMLPRRVQKLIRSHRLRTPR